MEDLRRVIENVLINFEVWSYFLPCVILMEACVIWLAFYCSAQTLKPAVDPYRSVSKYKVHADRTCMKYVFPLVHLSIYRRINYEFTDLFSTVWSGSIYLIIQFILDSKWHIIFFQGNKGDRLHFNLLKQVKYQVTGTLRLPLLMTSVRMLQGKLKHTIQRLRQDFIKMITEWKSFESNAATKFILQISGKILFLTIMFKSQLLVVKE